MNLIVKGATNDDIADMLLVSASVVKKRVQSIFWKLGCNRRAQAIRIWENPPTSK